MKYTVLKPFPYAHDGFTVRDLAVGDDVEIRDGVAPGLVAAGCLADPAAAPKKDGKGGKADKPAPEPAPPPPVAAEAPPPAPAPEPAPPAA